MKISDIPARFPVPFGASAGVGYIRSIPTSPTGTPGQASLETGFPPPNFSPLNAGGVPPFGQDMNGILNRATAWNQWQATGAFPPYDATFQTAISGYPAGACVASLVQFGLVWLSLVDDNVTNPDTGGAGWYRYIQVVTQNVDLYVNAATGSDSNNGLSPATAFATVQAAVNRAFGFPPSQYTININIAAGNYGGCATPFQGGPTVSIIGDPVTPSNVVLNGGTSRAISVTGTNTLFVNGIRAQATGGGDNAFAFYAGGGAVLTTQNTESGNCDAAVFRATSASIYIEGAHKFNGNAGAFFTSQYNSAIFINSSLMTLAGNMTVGVTAESIANSSIFAISPGPTWGGGGTVVGKRYNAALCGTINTQSGGSATFFPGSTPGTLSTGGQYI